MFVSHSIRSLTGDQLDLLPSDQDILRFKELGWHMSPVIIPPSVLNSAVEGADALMSGEVDCEIDGWPSSIDDKESSLINIEFASIQNSRIRQLANYPIIAATAAKLSGAKELRLFADSLICKKSIPADDMSAQGTKSVVGWHTDKAYWPTCTSDKMLTAWIPLVDCTIDMGPLIYLDGSHLWSNDKEIKEALSFRDNTEDFNTVMRNSDY